MTRCLGDLFVAFALFLLGDEDGSEDDVTSLRYNLINKCNHISDEVRSSISFMLKLLLVDINHV